MKSIFPEKSIALVKKHLAIDIFNALENVTTRSGFTLEQAIRSGVRNPDSAIGLYAGDADAYALMAGIFDPVIREYHGFPAHKIHASDFSQVALLPIDPEGTYIQSTRIRVARNLKNFCFPPHMTLSQRCAVETKIYDALDRLEDPFKGRYIHLEHASRTELDQLKQNNLLFEKGDRFQDAAGINLDFPRHRGVFCSADTRFIVWINEEDHMRIISLEKSSDLSSVYNRLSQGVALVNQTLEFAWNHTYGYLTACPTNIGTAMRAGVHIRLEKLARHKERLSALVEAYQLQIRGTSGEKTEVENAVFDISNRQRLGISESMIVRNLHKGLSAIITAEKSL